MFVYTNAARAGRTRPGLVETIDITDPRHRNFVHPASNRAALRERGVGVRKPVRLKPRRRPIAA